MTEATKNRGWVVCQRGLCRERLLLAPAIRTPVEKPEPQKVEPAGVQA